MEKNILIHASKAFTHFDSNKSGQDNEEKSDDEKNKERDEFMDDWTGLIQCTIKSEYDTLFRGLQQKYQYTAPALI